MSLQLNFKIKDFISRLGNISVNEIEEILLENSDSFNFSGYQVDNLQTYSLFILWATLGQRHNPIPPEYTISATVKNLIETPDLENLQQIFGDVSGKKILKQIQNLQFNSPQNILTVEFLKIIKTYSINSSEFRKIYKISSSQNKDNSIIERFITLIENNKKEHTSKNDPLSILNKLKDFLKILLKNKEYDILDFLVVKMQKNEIINDLLSGINFETIIQKYNNISYPPELFNLFWNTIYCELPKIVNNEYQWKIYYANFESLRSQYATGYIESFWSSFESQLKYIQNTLIVPQNWNPIIEAVKLLRSYSNDYQSLNYLNKPSTFYSKIYTYVAQNQQCKISNSYIVELIFKFTNKLQYCPREVNNILHQLYEYLLGDKKDLEELVKILSRLQQLCTPHYINENLNRDLSNLLFYSINFQGNQTERVDNQFINMLETKGIYFPKYTPKVFQRTLTTIGENVGKYIVTQLNNAKFRPSTGSLIRFIEILENFINNRFEKDFLPYLKQ